MALVAGLVVTVVPAVLHNWRGLRGGVIGSTAVSRPAPCLPGRPVPILPSPHVSPNTAVAYNSLPPTSGPHWAFAPAPGIYTSPLPDGLTVHGLEHGHIAVQYAPHIAAEQLRVLDAVARRFPTDVILAPYPKLAHGIALTAWGRLELLDAPDTAAVVNFVTALRDRYDHAWTRPDPC